MNYRTHSYPRFSACGLNCGLCPNYYLHTQGQFRCPGCAGEGFADQHPSCSILTCVQKNGLEYCFDCADFPCEKYEGADQLDSFITHKHQFRDIKKAQEIGMKAYAEELDQKVEILQELLEHYNDGRKKTLYCLATNLLNLKDVQAVMEQVKNEVSPDSPLKERAKQAAELFHRMAEQRNIELKLRKK